MFHADLHIHSKFSRACSRDCDIEHLAWWALRKGISVVGTGDFTHPAWATELRQSLIPAEPGLLRLRPELEERLRQTSPRRCAGHVRFMLSAEISTIYRGGEQTRKVHHLVYAPTFEAADRITDALSKIGNLASDGRPILGLGSRNLLEITLSGGPGCYLVPAHAWTPWFAVLGSKSGFDLVADCYADLAGEVFAIETGLSSDPPMNWMCSALDGYRLLSNSDAHSPPMLGREATTLSCDLDYFAIAEAFRTGKGLTGTIEFFPEEGRYHLDGHRKCGIRLEPGRSDEYGGMCPACGKPLTIGVLHRVAELADRPAGYRPPGAPDFTNLIQLRQIVGEIVATGPTSKKVSSEVSRLVAALGPELGILCDVAVSDVERVGGSVLAEALARLRRGSVTREAGYDGEYGTVRLFAPGELTSGPTLFDLAPSAPPASAKNEITQRGPAGRAQPKPAPLMTSAPGSILAPEERPGPEKRPGPEERPGPEKRPGPISRPVASERAPVAVPAARCSAPIPEPGPYDEGPERLLGDLDRAQQTAARADSPLMIVAGPGTGKTRTLTYRIAYQLATSGLSPRNCLAVTFTRRAAEEMRARLAALTDPFAAHQPARALTRYPGPVVGAPHAAAGGPAGTATATRPAGGGPGLSGVTVTTFHGLGLIILRELHDHAGLPTDFQVADDSVRQDVATELAGSAAAGRELLAAAAADGAARECLVKELTARGLVDFDGLIELPVALLTADPALAAALRKRWQLISVDEYQDIDAAQYDLLRLLAGDGTGLTAIGDPDQAIYGFRGADVGYFLRFGQDYPGATTRRLDLSYRSSRPIVAAAVAAIAPATLAAGRKLTARRAGAPVTAHGAVDEHAEASWIAAAIDQLLGGASFHSIDSGRSSPDGHAGLSLADIAVVYRTDAQSGVLGQALMRSGLPFRKGSHDLLQRRTAVPEILAEMRRAMPRFTPPRSTPPEGTPPRGTLPESTPPESTPPESTPPEGTPPVAELLAAAVSGLTSRRPGRSAVDVLAAGELLGPLARRCDRDPERFLTEVSLGATVDALDPRADVVTLLTLHAAKGLEFEVVFVAGCEDGLLPLRLPGPPGGIDAAEERRLLFVGMTRARSRLLISYAARRTRHGQVAEGGASPFLRNIDPGLLERSRSARPGRPAERQLRLL